MLIASAGTTEWIAGFTMGMSLADTFAISGGDAAFSGLALHALSVAGLLAAVFAAFVPVRWRGGEQMSEMSVAPARG